MQIKQTSITTLWLWLAVIVIMPIVLLVGASFLSSDNYNFILLKFSGHAWAELIDPLYLRIFLKSFEIALVTTLITLILGYPTAYLIACASPKYKSLLLLLLLIPFWTSSLIRTYAMIALLKTHGMINSLLLWLHIIHQPLQIMYSQTAVLIGLSYALLPYMILPIYANVEKLDMRLLDAAKDLGAKPLMIFRKITLPLTLPGIIGGVLLVFLPAMTIFYIPVLLGGGRTLLLGNLIENQFLEMQNWPGGAVTSLALTLIMLILLLVTKKVLRGKSIEL